MSQNAYHWTERRGRAGDAWARLPDYRVVDMLALLWRERLAAVAVFCLVAISGGVAVKAAIQPTYVASASVLVLQDGLYSADPLGGEAGRSSFQTQEQVQAELAFFRSEDVRRRVFDVIPPQAAFPNIGARGGLSAAQLESAAARMLAQSVHVDIGPNAPTLGMTLRHQDPDMAARLLNTLLDQYVIYRREVLLDVDETGFGAERRAADQRLSELSGEIEALLSEYNIGDFTGERAAAIARSAALETSLLEAQAEQVAIESQIEALTSRLEALPSAITLHVDDASAARLQELRLEREDLLSRYRPDSVPVEEINRRIERLEASLRSGGAAGGLTRRGVNPVAQTLQTELLQAESRQAALSARASTLEAQLENVRAQQLRLQQLAPDFERLAREHAAMETTVRSLAEREEAARTRRAATLREHDNIRIVQRASPPLRGESLRMPAFLLVLIFAAISGFVAAFMRAAVGKSSPNATSAERTLGVPVLAVVEKAA